MQNHEKIDLFRGLNLNNSILILSYIFLARQKQLEELGMALILPAIKRRYDNAATRGFKHYRESLIKLLKFYLDSHYNGVK